MKTFLTLILLTFNCLVYAQTVDCAEPIKGYRIVTATSEQELADSVASQISKGYYPEGDIVVHHNGEYYQQCVSRKNNESEILDFYTPVLGHIGNEALATIDADTVRVTVPSGSNLTNTVFGIVLSPGATSSISSPHTFVEDVATQFIVMAENGIDSTVWNVIIDIYAIPD